MSQCLDPKYQKRGKSSEVSKFDQDTNYKSLYGEHNPYYDERTNNAYDYLNESKENMLMKRECNVGQSGGLNSMARSQSRQRIKYEQMKKMKQSMSIYKKAKASKFSVKESAFAKFDPKNT